MTTNGKPREATELEAELLRLNALVRARRKQLARLDKCPNKDCPCRFVWREHVEKNLAGQVGKVRQQVRSKTTQAAKPKGQSQPRPAAVQPRRGMSRRRPALRAGTS
jgi:hypothetical protein